MKAKSIVALAIAVVLLGAGYALFKQQPTPESPRPIIASSPPVVAQVAPLPVPPPAAPAAPLANPLVVQQATPYVFDVVVKGGRRVSEPAVLKVHQGDDVKFQITSDVADEFHLHGYNLEVQVAPARSAVLQFTAKLTGRFTYELHKSGVELGALEVYPK